MTNAQVFVEVFPIRAEALPPLHAYKLIMSGDELAQQNARRVGSRLPGYLREAFSGYWAWIGGRLIVDSAVSPPKLAAFVEDLRAAFPRLFAPLAGVEADPGWQPTPLQSADWLVRGPLTDLEPTILEALARTVFSIRNTRVTREYRMRTWSVGGSPALSVSVVSRLLYEPDLQGYAATLTDATGMIGLWVADKQTGLQGEIVRLVGLLGEQRSRLRTLTTSAAMQEIIDAAPDDRWVVRVASGIRDYDYVTDALDLVIRPDDIAQFAINKGQLDRALHLKPAAHAQMVKLVSDVVKESGLIANAYNSSSAAHLFTTLTPQISLQWGDSRPRPYLRERLASDFTAHGAALIPDNLRQQQPVRLAVIDATSSGAKDFLEALRRAAERDAAFRVEIVRVRDMRVISQTNLDSAVRLLAKEDAAVILACLPDESEAAEEEAVNQRYVRLQTTGRALSSLIIHESAMQDPAQMPHLLMGLLARAGGAPYLLADPLPYADWVVGLSLFEQEKREGSTITGISRVYQSNGHLRYHTVAGDFNATGQGIPDDLLARLLPAALLRKQRVLLHIDGRLSRDAAQALGRWEDALDASFLTVELIRAGVPRLYALDGGRIEPPAWGSLFRLSEAEAFVQTADASVQPLHVRAEAPLKIEQAVESILAFTVLHYGTVTPSKLPVTIHQTESIEAGIARGIFPAQIGAETVFWL
ncbi:MAG: hypothetical protein JNL42_01290 [Anaerolineae bacterium]|nr:hypothetical protein [Anaerolineae bacterium]